LRSVWAPPHRDSSFRGKDLKTGEASDQSAQWSISAWTEFETVNALRSLCLRPGGPSPDVAESLRRWFKHLASMDADQVSLAIKRGFRAVRV